MKSDVTCADCGRELSTDDSLKTPCPTCGSVRFRAAPKVEPVVLNWTVMRPSVSYQRLRNTANLLLKGVLVPDASTDAGMLVEVVAPAWFQILRLLQDDPDAAFRIPPRAWEEIVAGAYVEAGFDEVTLTPASGDLGRDVIAVKRGIGKVRVIDQVKAYRPDHLVTANDVRALMGVLQGDGASKGFVTTTSDFAPKIADDPLIVPFVPSRLELVNGEQLLSRLKELASESLDG